LFRYIQVGIELPTVGKLPYDCYKNQKFNYKPIHLISIFNFNNNLQRLFIANIVKNKAY